MTQFLEERDRWILWLPVALGIGIGIYFALPAEPPLWLGAAGLALVVAIGTALKRRPAVVVAVVALAVLATGFTVAQWRTALVAAPMLAERLGPTSVTGRAVSVQTLPGSNLRVTLERLRVGRLEPHRTPERIRLRLGGRQPAVEPGDWVRLRAILLPPPAPAAPGAFDFQRQSFFRRLGAVGFSLGSAEILEEGGAGGIEPLYLALAKARRDISQRVLAGLDGDAGSVAAALMTGERGAIPRSLMAAIRDSGLAHLLAISGLHIGLVATLLFVGVRTALALVPPLALRYPIKKWAAVAAMAGALAYALIAGATVPTQRAFLMIGLVLLAVLVDRRGISMRLVAWAAVVVLLVHPEALLGASFQLSFAAVASLIAVYEVLRERRRFDDADRARWHRRVLLYVGGIALTTLVAGSATAPFAIFHFNRLAAYGLAANLVAVPVTALWIMPWAVITFLLMPLGLEGLSLAAMGWGIDVVVRVAGTVSAWPGAVTMLPAMPTWGLAAIALGGLWLCLWRRKWRLWGALGIAAGLAATILVRPPDVLIDGSGRLLAVRTGSGALAVSTRRAARFSRETWLRRAGQEGKGELWRQVAARSDRLSCDDLGCIYRAGGEVVALVRRPAALAEDCWIAGIVVSPVRVRMACPSAHTVIDVLDLRREGGHALWLEDGTVRVESVDDRRGRRPWVVRPPMRRTSH